MLPASRALVTGAAGFIGSHLSECLLDADWPGRRVDCFTEFYERGVKERNLERLRDESRFELAELDLAVDSIAGLTDGVDAVFHLAGQPGARQSFGSGAAVSARNNVAATERLLAEAAGHPPPDLRAGVLVHCLRSTRAAANAPDGSASAPQPLRGEQGRRGGSGPGGRARQAAPAIVLRYFSCYGPRQRPDMALATFIAQAAAGEPLRIFGGGHQRRDFTFVGDVVRATMLAAERGPPGATYNVGAGAPASLWIVARLLGEVLETTPTLELRAPARGDAWSTWADVDSARVELGFVAEVSLADGLAAQCEWALSGASLGVPGR